MSTQPHILVIGCGSIGERHLRCFLATNRARMAVCDANAALLSTVAERYGVPAHASLDEALAARDRFDALVICTPAHTHLPIALRGLEYGADLLIEKPLAVDLGLVEKVRRTIEQTRRVVAVAYVYHAMPWLQQARELLRSGELGAPLHATLVAGQHFPTFRPAYREIYYARHETGGGAIQDAFTHAINALEWLLGPVTRLSCDAAHQMLEGVEVEDTVNVIARHGNVLGSYSINQFQTPNEVTMNVHCGSGSISIEVHRQRWGVMRRGEDQWTWHECGPLERDELFTRQANAFLDAIQGLPHPLSSYDEAAQTLKFNLAALESARTGVAVNLA